MRKKQDRQSQAEAFEEQFRKKNVPLLILDEKWIEIFPEHMQNSLIREKAAELAELLKAQGKYVDELKGLKRYKSQMMQEIVENMGPDDSPVGLLKRRKLEKNHKKITQIKEDISEKEDALADIPYQIRDVNSELLMESTRICYQNLTENQERIDDLDAEIADVREKLKYLLLEKQDCEMKNEKIYTYLHSMLGPEMMEQLDEMIHRKNQK